jgi:hypothetical protein
MSACGLMQWATGEYLLAPFATRVSLELLAFAVAERKRCPERAAERVRRPYALRSRWARIEARILPLAVVVPWLALVMSESLKMGPALRGRCRPGQSAEAPGCEPRISVCGSHWCEAICWPVLQAVFILLASLPMPLIRIWPRFPMGTCPLVPGIERQVFLFPRSRL